MKTQTEKLEKQEKPRDLFCLASDAFRVFARHSSIALGSAWAFAGAVLVILVWVLTGPMFHFSDTWQLVINTATTIVTFLMVFLIQNTQNRDAKAVHLKLDELIRALKDARWGSVRRRGSRLQALSDAGSRVPFSYLRHLIRLFVSWRVPSSAIGMSANLSWPCAEVAFAVSFVPL